MTPEPSVPRYPAPSAPPPRGAFAWALYDFANTIFSMNVISLYFPQWVTVDRGREDLWYGAFYSASMLAVALTLPWLGLRSERGGLRRRYLALFTALSVAATASLGGFTRLSGTAGLVLALLAFAVANYAFQGGLVFYNALLPSVSTPATRGRVSGLGVGLGYVGSLLGMALVLPFVDGTLPFTGAELPFVEAGGRTAAFLPTAILFGLFALPLFFRVRDPAAPPRPLPSFRDALRTLAGVVADTARYPGVRRFLIANLLLLDGVHTAIAFMAVYAQQVVGLPDSAKVVLFMLATVPAVLGAFLAGWLADRLGPKPVLLVTAWLWVACPLAIAVTSSVTMFYVTAGVVGLILGSLWTSSRPFLLALTPPGEEGRLFGLYAFCNKSAAVAGPLLWGLVVLLGGPLGTARYRLAVATLAIIAGAGALVLAGVPSRRGEAPGPPSPGMHGAPRPAGDPRPARPARP